MNDAASRTCGYLPYGLIAIWAILAIYVLTLVSREKKIRRQIENLHRLLEDRQGK